jgi:caffeoyl-CoA O-methyltransferase
MTRSTLGLPASIENYLVDHSPQHPVARKLADVTAPLEQATMQIGPNQASFMMWLVKLLGAKRCIEIGTFTGFSSLATALALPDDGYLLACDLSYEWTTIARQHWAEAGVANKIDLVLQSAPQTLQERLNAGEAESFDFAFIDADKENYDEYYELCLKLVRRGGVIAFDNMLWGGSVADPTDERESTRAIRDLNDKVFTDPRVDCSLIPVGDGLLLATKK